MRMRLAIPFLELLWWLAPADPDGLANSSTTVLRQRNAVSY